MSDEQRPDPTPTPTPRPRRRAAAWGVGIVATLAVLGAAAAAAVATAWRSEAGTRWLLAHAPGVTAVDVQGAFGAGDVRIGSLRVVETGLQVDLRALHVAGLALRWRPDAHTWLGISLTTAEAASVQVRTTPSADAAKKPAGAPSSLRSPVAVDVAQLQVGTLTINDLAPLRDLRAALALGTEAGALHRVDRLSLGWERVQASGAASIRTDAPFAIDARLDAHDVPDPAAAAASAPPRALPHWSADARVTGPLAGFDLAAKLQGEARDGRAAPHAEASAKVTPFAALPVTQVLLQTEELDLGAISAKAPTTRLQGSVRVATAQPAALDVDLKNLAPAAFSAGGLPFSELTTHLEAPWNGRYLAIPALRVVLADAQGAGGELRAQGRWEGDKADVQLDLDQVQLARLDAHLGAWKIAGPLKAELLHLPAPASLWGAAPAKTPAAASAPADPASAPSVFAGLDAHLTGKLSGTAPPLSTAKNAVAPPPMTLQVDARAQADALQLQQFELKAGAATLTAQGDVRRNAAGDWQGDARAAWSQLDPGAWWRLAESGPLRTGPNLLNGSLAVKLANAPATWQGLAGLRGTAALTIAPSEFAGLPLEGKATVDATGSPWNLGAELHDGANTAQAEGTLRPGRANADAMAVIERLHLAVDAPQLALLAPLTGQPAAASPAALPASAAAAVASAKSIPGQLVAQAATKVATQGKTTDARALAPALAPSAAAAASAAANGPPSPAASRGGAKFDVLVTGGRLAIADASGRPIASDAAPLKVVTQGEVTDWSGPSLKLGRLQWKAEGSTDPRAPLAASVSLADLQTGGARVARADATLSGSLAEHRLQVQADAPVAPPQWLANLARIGNATATRLDVLLQGRWNPEARNAPAWQGHLAQLDLRAAGTAAAAASAAASATGGTNPAWVHVQPLDLTLSRDAAGAWQTLRVDAGAATIAGLQLNWQPSFWTAPATAGASAHWAFDVALAPFSVAQALALAQPDLGWHGDLQMAAQLHAAFDGQWHVAGQVARTSGDLSVSEASQGVPDAKQALGLTAALLSVKAEGLHWQADANVAGTRLGELTGRWTAEAPSPASLPQSGSPLQGNVKAHVADLNVWGAWLPPGWRLGGELRTDLALSGRWGAPQLTGQLTAQRLQIRNALEGVYGHDGDVAIQLAGDQARIERFHLVGGNGELNLSGSAALGATPSARLQLVARQFQLLGRIDRKLVTSGNIGLQLGADAIKVDGKLGIDEGLFDISRSDAPTLDSDVEVLGPTAAQDAAQAAADDAGAAAAAVPKTGRATQIALGIDLGEHLQLKGRGIETSLRGALQVTSPNGQLAVHGTVRTAGGQYTAYGQKLQITRGEVFFGGPVNDPRLDILANRPNLDVVVGVAITGTALAPHVQLVSQPEMTDAEKLSWLMLGRAPETTTANGADTALLQQAAMALLSGENEGPTDKVLSRLGLTDFGVSQRTDTSTNKKDTGTGAQNGETKQTVVTLGRQISKRVYVGYESSVNATTGNWQLIYRIAQRLTVRAQAGDDNSADVIYTWRWN